MNINNYINVILIITILLPVFYCFKIVAPNTFLHNYMRLSDLLYVELYITKSYKKFDIVKICDETNRIRSHMTMFFLV